MYNFYHRDQPFMMSIKNYHFVTPNPTIRKKELQIFCLKQQNPQTRGKFKDTPSIWKS